MLKEYFIGLREQALKGEKTHSSGLVLEFEDSLKSKDSGFLKFLREDDHNVFKSVSDHKIVDFKSIDSRQDPIGVLAILLKFVAFKSISTSHKVDTKDKSKIDQIQTMQCCPKEKKQVTIKDQRRGIGAGNWTVLAGHMGKDGNTWFADHNTGGSPRVVIDLSIPEKYKICSIGCIDIPDHAPVFVLR